MTVGGRTRGSEINGDTSIESHDWLLATHQAIGVPMSIRVTVVAPASCKVTKTALISFSIIGANLFCCVPMFTYYGPARFGFHEGN